MSEAQKPSASGPALAWPAAAPPASKVRVAGFNAPLAMDMDKARERGGIQSETIQKDAITRLDYTR